MNRFKLCFLICIGVGGASAMSALLPRLMVEANNRTVEICLDFGELESISQIFGPRERASGVTKVWQELRGAGATSVAVSIQTIDQLVSRGELYARSGVIQNDRRAAWLLTAPKPTRDQVAAVLNAAGASVYSAPGSAAALVAEALPPEWRELEVAYPQDAMLLKGKVPIVARFSNPTVNPERLLQAYTRLARELGAGRVVFLREMVGGYPKLLTQTAELLREAAIGFGLVEFGKQYGDVALGELMPESVVRVHSIETKELRDYPPKAAVERFVRAVKERNIRLLYVHLYLSGQENVLMQNIAFLEDLAESLRREGFRIGRADPIRQEQPLALTQRVGMAVGVAGALGLVLEVLWANTAFVCLVAVVLLFIIKGLLAINVAMATPVAALITALLFGTCGISLVPALPRTMSGILGAYFQVSLISLTGGLHAAAMLSTSLYMNSLRSFVGVKIALILPVLAVGLVLLTEATKQEPETLRAWRRRVSKAFKEALAAQVTWGQALFCLAILVAVSLVVVRSGNDAPSAVSGFELKLRSLMDAILPVRPRTKEVFLGHPAIIIGMWLRSRGNSGWASVFLTVGFVGQTDIINTFCHIHTPISVSLLRVAVGFVLGGAIGFVMILAASKLNLGVRKRTI